MFDDFMDGVIEARIEIKIWHGDDVEVQTLDSIAPAQYVLHQFKNICFNTCYLSEPAMVTAECNREMCTYMNIAYVEQKVQ